MEDLHTKRRVAIIGAGPVGVEAAHAFVQAGCDVQLYERGEVGENVGMWGHVTLFSQWALNTSSTGLEALTQMDVSRPDPECFPTGAQYVRQYLRPLANHPCLKGRVHTRTNVVSIGRSGLLKGQLLGSGQRRNSPFRILLEDSSGERVEYADVVIDATGCFGTPNRLGDGGICAPGERRAARGGALLYGLPGSDQFQAGSRTLVVGAGYSAISTLKVLMDRGDQKITWITLGDGEPYERIADDPLPQRDALAALGNSIAAGQQHGVKHIGGVVLDHIDGDGPLTVSVRRLHDDEVVALDVDKIVANVGFRPDWSLVRELQFHQCWGSEGPMKLAAALLGASGGGDCLAQASQGPDALLSPEPDFFVLGAKSFGRNSSFLIKLGLAQIQDVIQLLDDTPDTGKEAAG